MTTRHILYLALAGAGGTLARYGVTSLVQRTAAAGSPLGTAAVNLLGCFLAGLIWSMAEARVGFSDELRTILLVGFMGAFTTFSAFMLDTSILAREVDWLRASLNLLLQNGLGLVLLVAGLAAGRSV